MENTADRSRGAFSCCTTWSRAYVKSARALCSGCGCRQRISTGCRSISGFRGRHSSGHLAITSSATIFPTITFYARQGWSGDWASTTWISTAGFGFPNPKGSPGYYPDEGLHTFVNATRHLSEKATLRAAVYNSVPPVIRKAVFGFGWRFKPAANADFAAAIRRVVSIPVIANGGFQDRDVIDGALADGKCDLVAIARPLLANPDMLEQFRKGASTPEPACSFCSLCCSHTAVFPLGCYDQRRFDSQDDMLNQILGWCSPNAPFSHRGKLIPSNQIDETRLQ